MVVHTDTERALVKGNIFYTHKSLETEGVPHHGVLHKKTSGLVRRQKEEEHWGKSLHCGFLWKD